MSKSGKENRHKVFLAIQGVGFMSISLFLAYCAGYAQNGLSPYCVIAAFILGMGALVSIADAVR